MASRIPDFWSSGLGEGGQSAQETLTGRVGFGSPQGRLGSGGCLGTGRPPDMSQRTPQTGMRNPEPPDSGFPSGFRIWGVSRAEP